MKAELKRSGKNWTYLLDENEVFTTRAVPRFRVLLEDGEEPYTIGIGYSECDQVLKTKLPFSCEKLWYLKNAEEDEFPVDIVIDPKDCKLILNTTVGTAKLVYSGGKVMDIPLYSLHNFSDIDHTTVGHYNGYIKDAVELTLSGEVKVDKEMIKKVKRNYKEFVKEWIAETSQLFKDRGVVCKVEKWS